MRFLNNTYCTDAINAKNLKNQYLFKNIIPASGEVTVVSGTSAWFEPSFATVMGQLNGRSFWWTFFMCLSAFFLEAMRRSQSSQMILPFAPLSEYQ